MAFVAQAPGFRPTAPADPTGLAPSGICICDSGASKGDSPGKASPASREHCAQGEPPAGDAASRGPQGDGPPQWSLRHPPTTLRPHDQTDHLGLLILCAPAPDSGIDPPNHPHPLHSLPQVFSRNRTPFLSGTRWTRQDGSCSLTSTPAPPAGAAPCRPWGARRARPRPRAGVWRAPLPSPGRRAWPRQTLPESGQGLWPQGPGGVLSVPLGPELGTLRDGGPPRGHRVGPRGRPGLRPLYVHTLRAHVS